MTLFIHGIKKNHWVHNRSRLYISQPKITNDYTPLSPARY